MGVQVKFVPKDYVVETRVRVKVLLSLEKN
jgi:hypothetical protein